MKRKIIFNLVLSAVTALVSLPGVMAQTANKNYIITYAPRTPQTDASVVPGLSKENVQKTIAYYDGLGRNNQMIQIAATPAGKDLVTPVKYDNFGREANKYLPYATTAVNSGTFVETDLTNQIAFYTGQYNSTEGNNAFAQTDYEASPLNRILRQGAPGSTWQPNTDPATDHSVKYAYGTNILNEVKRWRVTNDNLTDDGVYAAATLFKTTTWDENANSSSATASKTDEFKDVQGNVVLKVAYDGTTATPTPHYTYYVYDDFGLLRFVLPPQAFADGNFSISDAEMSNLCYQYRYDECKRMKEKKLPGAGWVFMIYDKLDRLVLQQDAKLRGLNANKYHYTIYDALNRPVEQGISTETLAYQSGSTYPLRSAVSASTGFSPSGTDLQVYTCYDSYTTPATWGTAYNYNQVYTDHIQTNNVKGLVTGVKAKVLGTTSTWVYTVNYYDKYGKLIQSYQSNPEGGYNRTTMAYNFTGQPTKKQVYHKRTSGSAAITTEELFTYDHMGRLLTTQHSYNGAAFVTITQNTYDELGRASKKELHNGYQDIDYRYNIRGWLTRINDPDAISNNNLFAQELFYDTDMSATLAGSAQFNGNINGIKWRNWNNGTLTRKGYNFIYDGLNRLTQGDYGTYSGSWGNTNTYDLSGVTYDRNGNISTMNCKNASGSDKENLNYTYTGNQLNSVSGTYNSITGKTGSFTYDANGNAISDGLRGLASVTYYDEIDLPRQYFKDANNKVDYQYDASGNKWGKTATTGGTASTMNYYGGFIYQGSTLGKVLTPEGFYDPVTNLYHYYLKDHLGNTRITFHYGGTTAVVDQEAEYYPFGAMFAQNNLDKNVYLYNGKELNNEFFENYDYGARFYDPVIPHFTSVDPHADKYYNFSPYAYCLDNPLRYIDPNGKDVYSVDKDGNIELKRRNHKDYDRIKAKGTLFNSMKVDKTVMAGMKTNTINTGKDGIVSLTKFQINGDKKGEAFFQFMAKNTNVEWSNVKIGEGDWNTNLVGTSHKQGRDYSVGDALNNPLIMASKIRGIDHSHPNNTSYISPADRNVAQIVQMNNNDAIFRVYTPLTGTYYPFDQNSIPGLLEEVIVKPQ